MTVLSSLQTGASIIALKEIINRKVTSQMQCFLMLYNKLVEITFLHWQFVTWNCPSVSSGWKTPIPKTMHFAYTYIKDLIPTLPAKPKIQGDFLRTYRRSFGRSGWRDSCSSRYLFPQVFEAPTQSASPQANKLKIKHTMVIVDAGNFPCYYARIPCTSANINIEAYKSILGKNSELKTWNLKI